MEEEYGDKEMRQVIREIFGMDQVDGLREIARKTRSYDRIMNQQRPVNVRGTGRRGKFMDDDVDLVMELYQQGKTAQHLAEFFDASRQTIYKYLALEKRFLEDPFITMRMHYLYKDQVCMVIDVDFMHEKIYIRNKTEDILHRVFGILEEPTQEDFEDFLENRCFPRSRANLKNILRDIGVPSYDPLQIIEKTGGRMAENHRWIQIFYRGDDKGGGNGGDGDS